MTDGVTRRLLEHVAQRSAGGLSAGAVDGARRVLLDHLACGVHGSQFEWTRHVEAESRDTAGARAGTVVYGSAESLPPVLAARVNGTAAHGFELDDFYQPGMVHPGSVVVPAALAVGESVEATLGDVLTAIAHGYEVVGRISAGLGLWHNSRGFHTTGVTGAFGAGVAAGVLRGFDIAQQEQVIGVAASLVSGIKAFQSGGGMIKRLHAGRAAESGLLAANLVARGFTGPVEPLAGPRGVFDVYGGDDSDPQSVLEDLDATWVVERIYFKPYSACAMTHTAIEAIQGLVTEHGISIDEVLEVRIGTCEKTFSQNTGAEIVDTMSAQYSLEYAVSVALENAGGDPASFLPEGLTAARTRRMALVTVDSRPEMQAVYPAQLGAVVDIRTARGEFHAELLESAEQSDGAGSWSLVRRKARTLLSDVLGSERADLIVAAVCDASPGTPLREVASLVAR